MVGFVVHRSLCVTWTRTLGPISQPYSMFDRSGIQDIHSYTSHRALRVIYSCCSNVLYWHVESKQTHPHASAELSVRFMGKCSALAHCRYVHTLWSFVRILSIRIFASIVPCRFQFPIYLSSPCSTSSTHQRTVNICTSSGSRGTEPRQCQPWNPNSLFQLIGLCALFPRILPIENTAAVREAL